MKFLVIRHKMTDKETLGRMYIIDDTGKAAAILCTLELPWRDNQRQISCVPEGEYEVSLSWSRKFNMNLYVLSGVPNRSGIMIHSGNHTSQIEGCILVGLNFADINADGITDVIESRKALNKVHTALNGVKKTTIKIVNL